jgi:ligand-binding sensor domain-containing protein
MIRQLYIAAFLVLYLLFGSHGDLFAQTLDFEHFTSRDGLPTNKLYNIIEDMDGFIWISSQNGVCRYDGYDFKKYTKKSGLISNDIFFIREDDKKNIWCFSFDDKISIISDSVKLIELPADAYAINQFSYLKGDHRLLRLSKNGWYNIDSTKFLKNDKSGRNKVGLPFNSVIDFSKGYPIFQDRVGNKLRPKLFDSTSKFTVAGSLDGITMLYNRSEFLLFGEHGEFYHGLWNDFVSQPLNIKSPIRFVISNGTYQILASDEAVISFDRELKLTDHFDFNGQFTGVGSAIIDSRGNVWIGTKENGLFFLSFQKRKVITNKFHTSKSYFYPSRILVDGENTYVTGSYSGVVRNNTILFDGVDFPDASTGIFRANSKSLIIVGSDETRVLNESHKQAKLKPIGVLEKEFQRKLGLDSGNNTMNPFAKSAVNKNDSCFFISTTGQTILIQMSKELVVAAKVIAPRKALALAYAKGRGLYMGGQNGIYFWDEKLDSCFHVCKSLSSSLIVQLRLFNDVLFIGTQGEGMWYAKINALSKVLKINTKGDLISDIFSQQDSTIWASSEKGIEQFELRSGVYIRVSFLNSGNFLPTDEINCIAIKNDTLLAGSYYGLTRIPLSMMGKRSNSVLPFFIYSFKGNGVQNRLSERIKVAYSDNKIELKFAGIDYSASTIEYRYKLNGVNKQWQSTKSNFIEYNNLPSGSYNLMIKARSSNGGTSKVLRVSFDVLTPFYKKLWFIILESLFALAIIGFITKRWSSKREKKIKVEADLKTRFGELELRALQAQMNPHFIFNALGSIQYYMSSNVDLADKYLSKFASLMRMFLESSKTKFNTINKEIELINLYVELENMRLSEKFVFSLRCDDEIDTFEDKIPTMLLQPFIENAINHGLFHLENRVGTLSVSFQYLNEEHYKVLIEDNGIGRAKAAEIKASKKSDHKSRAMEIVNEKVEVMNKLNKMNIEFKIIDNFDVLSNASGTLIEITIPY